MTTKRTSAESSSDGQTIGNSDSVFQQEDNAKHAKLASLSDTTIQDLPIETLEYILIKVVTMEVLDAKLVKSAWKEEADHVIDRLRTVCLHWSSVLTTNFFRNTLHRILEGTAQGRIGLEILHQSTLPIFTFRVATTKDEMFMLCIPENQDPFINVCDRNNMALVKDVIPLPGVHPVDMAACSLSNCVYVLNKTSHCISVLRITQNEEHKFDVSPWINDLSLSFPYMMLFVSVNSNLIILSKQPKQPSVVSVYDVNGSMQHSITLVPAIHGFRIIYRVIQKSNGNLVLAICNDELMTELKEIDSTGSIVRHYCSSIYGDTGVNEADAYGTIVILGQGNRAVLLDSEFNLIVDLSLPHVAREYGFQTLHGMHYNSERNEIVRLYQVPIYGGPFDTKVLTIFRFTTE